MFIELKQQSGKPLYIRCEDIDWFGDEGDGENRVHLRSGFVIDVKSDVILVLRQIIKSRAWGDYQRIQTEAELYRQHAGIMKGSLQEESPEDHKQQQRGREFL